MVHSDLSSDAKTKKKQMQYIEDFIEECYAVLKTGERAEIEKLMDLDSLVDTYLVEEFGKNFDTGHDSYYLYKEKGGKLFFGPIWDFDLTLGNADLSGNAASYEGLFTALTLGADSGNPWYYTPMKFEWFRKMVADRWNEVKETVFKTMPEDVRKDWIQKIPLRRGGTVEDIANVATFLASDLSSYVSGQVIQVDGGMNM